MDEFYKYMNREEQQIHTILSQNNEMIELSEEENTTHRMATVCNM